MVGSVCIVLNCSTATPSNISMFRFPRDVKRFVCFSITNVRFVFYNYCYRCLRWIVACNCLPVFQRCGSSARGIYKSRYRVCALHFEDSMYCDKIKKKRLHLDAVPTLNLKIAASSLVLDVPNQLKILPRT